MLNLIGQIMIDTLTFDWSIIIAKRHIIFGDESIKLGFELQMNNLNSDSITCKTDRKE